MDGEEWKTRVTNIKLPSATRGEKESACLVLIYPPGPEMGKRFVIPRGTLTIGRGSDCDVTLDMDSVSRLHARLERRGGSVTVTDADSTNGTYVNEQSLTKNLKHTLKNSDLLQVGNAIFKFIAGNDVETTYYEAIYRMTIVDGLTEAHNKRYLMDFLDRELARCIRYGRPLSVVIFDLDHFKKINDTHGHLTGDYVLRELSRRVRSRIRREELFARYGGEEFVVVLPEADHKGALEFAEQIRQLVGAQPFSFEGEVFHVTISVGVATRSDDISDALGFLKIADENLYRAKRAGRNRVVG